jgi:hypothetical protein
MDFFVLREEISQNETLSVVIQDSSTTLLYLKLPSEDDNIKGWLDRLKYMSIEEAYKKVLDDLLRALPRLLGISVAEDAYPTFLNMMRAVFSFLDSPSVGVPFRRYDQSLKRLERELHRFEVEVQNDVYIAAFFCLKEKIWEIQFQKDKFDIYPVEVSYASLAASYQKDPQQIHHFIDNHIHFQSGLTKNKQPSLKVFTNLSKALVRLIEKDIAGLGIYMSLIPEICTFIVKNEVDDVESRKEYLERILNSRESTIRKYKKLDSIIFAINNDNIQQNPQANASNQSEEDRAKQLIQVISLISDHYLRRYDFESSLRFWKFVQRKDTLLRFFLTLHRRPQIYCGIQILLLLLLSFFINSTHQWGRPMQFPIMHRSHDFENMLGTLQYFSVNYLPFVFILLWYVPLFFAAFVVMKQILSKKKIYRWLYSQLLLPRIFGASVVGLIPLFLNDQSWLLGIRSSIVNLILLGFFTYFGAFLYIFVEVHNSTKYLEGRTIAIIFDISGKIFFIAFAETLFIVTVTSMLVFPAVVPLLNDLNSDKSLIYSVGPGLSFGFFLTLILLWTGIALFIGSFVQLLWQDRRITDPL